MTKVDEKGHLRSPDFAGSCHRMTTGTVFSPSGEIDELSSLFSCFNKSTSASSTGKSLLLLSHLNDFFKNLPSDALRNYPSDVVLFLLYPSSSYASYPSTMKLLCWVSPGLIISLTLTAQSQVVVMDGRA